VRIDEVLSVVNSTGKYWYETDALGSTYAMTNATGAVVSRSAYDVFGERALTAGADLGQPFGFTGREHDQGGLVYARNRYLNSASGRWTQPDRLGMPDGPNRFVYVSQRPTGLSDPSGHFFIAPMFAGAIIGGLFNGLTGYMSGLKGWALFENIILGATTGAISAILPPFPSGSVEFAGAIAGGAVAALQSGVEQLIQIVQGVQNGFDRNAFIAKVVSGAVAGLLGGAFSPGSKMYQSLVRSIEGTLKEQWQFMMTSAMLGGIAGGIFDTVIAYVQMQSALDDQLFGSAVSLCLPLRPA
jgi:RHS repeat-associated protein